MSDFEEPGAELAGSLASQTSQNLKFEREDLTSFRTIEGLQQKAGVAKDKLRRLVLKELTDNGLDEGGEVRIGDLPGPGGGYFVEDNARGIDGTRKRSRACSVSRGRWCRPNSCAFRPEAL
jgi:hypothetical protein